MSLGYFAQITTVVAPFYVIIFSIRFGNWTMRSWVNGSSLYLSLNAVSASNLYVDNPIAIKDSTINIDIWIDQAVKNLILWMCVGIRLLKTDLQQKIDVFYSWIIDSSFSRGF